MPHKGNVDKSDVVSTGEKIENSVLCDNDSEDKFEDSSKIWPKEGSKERVKSSSSGDGNESSSTLITSSIVPSFVRLGLQRKAPFSELKYWIALSLTLDGRDKITKVLQYTSRLLGWWFLSKAGTSRIRLGHGRRFTNLYKSLGKSRKAFRLGRSINEMQKISNMGLLGLFCWHLRQQYVEESNKIKEDENIDRQESDTSILSLSPNIIVSNIKEHSHRMRSVLISSLGAVFPSSNESSKVQWWKLIGSALKTIGMLGYWLGDNANFLTSSGVLDNYSLSDEDRSARRRRWQDITGKKANQFYFFATIIGFATNSYAYFRFHSKKTSGGQGKIEKYNNENFGPVQSIELKEEGEREFALFLALLKSCMDLIVFSNNPGIDFHIKWRGRKNHEAIHCLCGLISAGSSLCNSFPDAKV